MKQITSFFLVLFVCFSASAQIKNPVKWNYAAKKISATAYELHFTAQIDPGWHIYTQEHKGDIGIATSFKIKANPLGTLNGKVKTNAKAIAMKDPSTGQMVKFYTGIVDFVQVVKLKAAVKTNYTGELEFMACDDKQCLPPTTKTFSIDLN